MSSATTIRPFQRNNQADVEAVVKLGLIAVPTNGIKIVCGKKEISNKSYFDKYSIFVAECDGKIVGSIGANIRSVLFEVPDRFEKVSWLSKLRIDPKHRRGGLAIKLVKKMEDFLASKGVSIIFGGIYSSNIPSIRLFTEHLQYTSIFEPGLAVCGINVKHNTSNVCVRERLIGFDTILMDVDESQIFLRCNFGGSFLLPSSKFPVDCNVYQVRNRSGESLSVAVTLANVPWTFSGASLLMKLDNARREALSWLLPWYYEKPVPFDEPVFVRHAFPFKSTATTLGNFNVLLEVLFSFLCLDMAEKGVDVVRIHHDTRISGLSEKEFEVFNASKFISPRLFLGDSVTRIVKVVGKSDEEAKEMYKTLLKQSFWFTDANEL